jgi:GntR family transcriptional regulator
MFVIDLMSRTPVYEQIIKQVENQILMGILNPGDKMPSVRNLSIDLSVNPNTIQKAYTELDRRQIIVTVPGKGSFISERVAQILGKDSRKKLDDLSALIRELLLAGITKEEIVKLTEELDAQISQEKKES